MSESAHPQPTAEQIEAINSAVRYTAWTVFARTGAAPADGAAGEVERVIAELAERDVVVRGLYDVSTLRADADLMVWMHADEAEAVQDGIRRLRRTGLGPALRMVWSGMGLHRPPEFNKGHVPSFMMGLPPKRWLCMYPFVRSYDWYLLPDAERRELLAEHGRLGRDHPGIQPNTVAAFALGDYEWILALEADELHEHVDMMRHLRESETRLHVREEIPFYTGCLVSPAEAVELLR